jgi:methyl-accepting chemotaxis protein
MTNKKPRKKYIVDSSVQYKVLAVIVIYIFVAILLTGFLMFIPSILGLSSKVGQEQYAAAKEVLMLHKRFWPSILIVVVLLGAHSIYLFHRLFGPLYHLNNALKQITGGDLSFTFKIRKKDFLKREEKIMNELLSSLREKLGPLKKDNALLLESITQLSAELDSQDMSLDSVKNRISDIQLQQEKIAHGFDSFKIDNS